MAQKIVAILKSNSSITEVDKDALFRDKFSIGDYYNENGQHHIRSVKYNSEKEELISEELEKLAMEFEDKGFEVKIRQEEGPISFPNCYVYELEITNDS